MGWSMVSSRARGHVLRIPAREPLLMVHGFTARGRVLAKYWTMGIRWNRLYRDGLGWGKKRWPQATVLVTPRR